MEPTKMDLYAVQGYNLLTMRDRIVKITSDIDHATIAHNSLIARLQAELADLNNKVLEEGFVLTNMQIPTKIHPMYWKAGDVVKRISEESPNLYTIGKEYTVMSTYNDSGRQTILIFDDFVGTAHKSYCVYGLEEAQEKFEFVK